MPIAFLESSNSSTVFRSSLSSTSLFANSTPSPIPIRPTTFGQFAFADLNSKMNSQFSTTRPECPCCAFLTGGNLFLPWNEDEVNSDGLEYNVFGTGHLSSSTVEEILTPTDAWDRIATATNGAIDADTTEHHNILLVDTHGHPHLEREVQYADKIDNDAKDAKTKPTDDKSVVSLTCGVSPLDWNDALNYASQSQHILPALGVHPWYLGDIMVDGINNIDNINEDIGKYLKWDWLSDLETHLSKHPHLLVGEIGLCKMARFVREFPKDKGGKATALQLQKLVFQKQLDLAAKWSRPITVHCVNAHGLFMEVMTDTLKKAKESCTETYDITEAKIHWKKAFPPAIAMHSFTGTAHHVGEILAFEKELLHPEEVETGGKGRRRKQKQQSDGEGEDCTSIQNEASPQKCQDEHHKEILFYFGFSHSVNHIMCTSEKARKKGSEAVRAIPPDRILVESDVHHPLDVTLGTAGAVAYAAQVREESLEEVAKHTTENGLRFLSSLGIPN